MKAVFVADAHIKGIDDPCQRTLADFFESLVLNPPDKLILLGDIFEFWTDIKRVVYDQYRPLLASLLKLTQNGTELIYLEGNHDFSMGRFFTEILRARVHTEACEIFLNGKKTYLSHGDTIDKSLAHAVWKAFLRSFLFKAVIKILPPSFTWKIAMALSKRSRYQQKKSPDIECRLKGFANEIFQRGIDVCVLGHSHIPSIDEKVVNGRVCVYANPGSWMDNCNYLVYEDGRFRLERCAPSA